MTLGAGEEMVGRIFRLATNDTATDDAALAEFRDGAARLVVRVGGSVNLGEQILLFKSSAASNVRTAWRTPC